jgi:hypothetical protein
MARTQGPLSARSFACLAILADTAGRPFRRHAATAAARVIIGLGSRVFVLIHA